jgi:hypothetical protein
MKHHDSLWTRDIHKCALVYVGRGQESKETILHNQRGSAAFEHFVDALGWTVDLDTHAGYMGGLAKGKGTTPYYADSTCELVWHVSTRLPLDDDGVGAHKRLRHLGNDEVLVVWSEHWRPYHRSTIATGMLN